MIKVLQDILRNETGATAIEYGLIAALVSIAAIGALTAMGSSLDTMFTSVANELETATN
jgi:pilus assembly protein Flp/PilA